MDVGREEGEPTDRFAPKPTTLAFMRAIMRRLSGSYIVEKRRLGLCVSSSLCDCVSLRETIFFPIPRNRRRYVGIRSVRSYRELHDIFILLSVIFFRSRRREKVEVKSR